MQAPKEIIELIERFERNIDAYKSGKYNETALRREFVDPLFKALGWDIDNEQGNAEAYKDVVHEDSIKIGGGTKAPDYCFRIGGQRKFFVEAKKPSLNIKNEPAAAYQIRRYAWSAKLPLSILTDFEEFSVFDCQVKPNKRDSASVARVGYYTYKDYIEKWDEIASVFSKDAVYKGSFDKYAQSGKKKRGTTEVDDIFLKEIEKWRESLAKNIAASNPKLSQEELNFAVQKTIDRIIFLRICEDRLIEDYGRLMALQNGTQVYERLCQMFRQADDKYNSGLFHFNEEKGRPEHYDGISLKLKIEDKTLKDIIKGLYYPDSPYEFSVLPSDILGHVYEQFLGKVIRLTAGHRAVIEEKPEARKAGGIYYTPTYIVNYIVKNTVGKLLEGKNPEKVSKLRVLDPACGSGSFLIQAYQCLLDWHRDYYINDDPGKHAKKKNPALFKGLRGEWALTTSEKKRILLNNIYGVDIDSQAVEVTKLSLLLKVLEGETDQTINSNLRLFNERALPDLGSNIKCGNSLIGPDFYKNKNLSLFGSEEMKKINVFDWTDKEKGFGEIMASGGFDAVIGNPPYFNIQTLGVGSQEANYIMNNYKDIWQDKSDILFYFVHKAITLSKGNIGFIISNAFLFADKAQKLRNFIIDKIGISKIVNFEKYLVFKDASITTAVVIFEKNNKTGITRALSLKDKTCDNLQNILFDDSNFFKINLEKDKVFSLINQSINRLNKKIDGKHPILRDVVLIGKGMETAANEVFCFKEYPSRFPKEFIRKRMSGEIISKYFIGKEREYLLYIEDVGEFRSLPKPIKNVLSKNEKRLSGRADKIRRKSAKWWNYSFPMHREYYRLNKIWCSYRSRENAFVYDNTKEYIGLTNTTVIFDTNKNISLKYVLALLNSRALNFRYKSIGKQTGNGIYEYFENGVGKLPIPIIDKKNQGVFVELVDQMLETQKKLHSAKTERDKEHYQQKAELLDKQIDALVYELYGLTEEEIKVVEGMD